MITYLQSLEAHRQTLLNNISDNELSLMLCDQEIMYLQKRKQILLENIRHMKTMISYAEAEIADQQPAAQECDATKAE